MTADLRLQINSDAYFFFLILLRYKTLTDISLFVNDFLVAHSLDIGYASILNSTLYKAYMINSALIF